ncbi:uncharacterized protein [Hetaerina americana]|uniref:uncharacterized protein isoform X2 n=1 Tax=Hetaerina americana TaxID=62018 RepID=UPI003A7F4401
MAPPPPLPQPALPPMREVTEDTPPDMLAGAMDLRVLLPDGHAVKMNVDRSTPMMDLLVHVTTANKMSPGSHVIQAVGEKGNILPYKPSTPIGALDTWTIQVVSKSKTSGVSHKKAPLKPANQPFEQTFRLQVNLPRNQLFVTRVSPRTPLLDVLRHVCAEKGLDPEKYDLRNPINPDEVLCLTSNLLDYKLQEVTVALRGSTVPHNHHSRHRIHTTSAADIISLQHQQQQLADIGEKRRKSSGSTSTTNNSGGVFGFIFKRGSRSSVCEGSVSSDSLGGHSISPARSDESLGPTRSASPPLSHPRAVGATQDQLRNQINSQMSRRQDSATRAIPVASEKNLKLQMEEGQPPPPPVRHRKRRAPKPPVQNSVAEGKLSILQVSSEFITPAPPSEPAPIPVSRRKSGPLDDDEDEYDEEDIMVRGGRGRNIMGKMKSNHVGGTTTGGTIISHSRNSSDSSGYHEASVLSESPESGVGGSGAPDTLPRRKQQQQQQMQRSSACVTSQLPPFSRSMGNLAASNGPPSSASTASSKTMTSSSSYSSLSASTSSLPGQKKKKAPAPPPPPVVTAPAQQSIVTEVHERVAIPAKSTVPMQEISAERTSPVLNGSKAEEDLANSHCNALVEQPKPKPQMENPPKHNAIPVTTRSNSQLSNESQREPSTVKPVVCPVGPASKPVASVTKSGPAVAPKPQSKVNTSADAPRPLSQNGPDSEDVIPAPLPRSKPPMPKKRTAPRPAPRSKPSVVSDAEMNKEESLPQNQKEVVTQSKAGMPSGLSALSIVPAIEIESERLNGEEEEMTGGCVDELMGEGIDLDMFNNDQVVGGRENDGVKSGNSSAEEEFDEEVVQKALTGCKARAYENILDSNVDESTTENVITGISLEGGDEAVEGFSFKGNNQTCGDRECDSQPQTTSSRKFSDVPDGEEKGVSAKPSDFLERHVISPIRQVESAVNFSNIHKGFTDGAEDPNRFSSNSLCSEVDMPFVDGCGGSTKMNRWQNMESLVQSSSTSSLEKHVKEMVALGERAMEEDDSVSANWVVGYESDTEGNREAGDGSEEASNADTADSMTVDSIDEVDCSRQQAIDSAFEETEKLLQPLKKHETVKEPVCNHVEKMNGVDVPPTLLPSPPPSLEYMGPDGGKTLGPDGRADGAAEANDLDWEYKLPAPPTGFQDEEERRDGAEEIQKANKKDERETWVAESETASIPSTFSSAASHRKIRTVEMDNLPVQHLPNFRMSTYKASSEDGWEDPREEFNRRRVVDDCFGRTNGRTFVMLNSDGEANSEKSFREPRKNSFETWASVSSKSSLNRGHYSNLDLSNPSPYGNTSLVMTSFKDTAENGYEPNGVTNNGPYVVRVSSFGGKSSTVLKRSLSSTSSLVSRHSINDGKDVMEKFDRELGGNIVRNNLHMKNGMENHSLSNASRTVSLHDLAINRIQEERRTENHLNNGYHDENTTPKIVSSKWKKPQVLNGGPGTKFVAKKFNNIQNLRKTSSELSINQGYANGWKDQKDELNELVSPRQIHHWQDHVTIESHMQEPLKSIQVMRGVLPHLKKSLSSELTEQDPNERRSKAVQKVDPKEENGVEGVQDKDEMSDNQPAKSNSLPRPNHHQSSSDVTNEEEVEDEVPKRYSYTGPPAINFGTWNERPKSEVSLKRDSDYRIGVGQAPRIREFFIPPAGSPPTPAPSSPKTIIPSSNHHPPAGSQVDSGPPCPPPKPSVSNRVTVNIVSANKPEPVSRLPIVRSVELKKTVSAVTLRSKPDQGLTARPMSCKFPSDLREELSGALASLVDANRSNGESKQGEEINERRRRQQIPSVSALPPPPPDVVSSVPAAPGPVASNVTLRRAGSAAGHEGGQGVRMNGFMGHEKRQGNLMFAPVVKGFRVNSVPSSQSPPMQTSAHPVLSAQPSVTAVQPPPPPPPAVVCGVALKKRVVPSSGPKVMENPRDQLLTAIRDFGGKENLKKTALRYK